MTDQIKNRVVGTVVIFALAIIFLPDILDGKKQQTSTEFVSIPVKPVAATVAQIIAEPSQQVLAPKSPTIDPKTSGTQKSSTAVQAVAQLNDKKVTQRKPIASSAKPKPKPKPAASSTSPVVATSAVPKPKAATWRKQPSTKPTINAWAIAVGSFNDPANAKSLLVKLRTKGFTAFSVPAKPRKGDISKVYVGPSTSKAKLTSLQPKLKAAINESGYITVYNPTEK
ncbi:MAG: SPOR domain-containing protein [Gammaproteobacteria bacterium]|nr:SPOR domain-containing protein [Gammaproteobacteria bacterium]